MTNTIPDVAPDGLYQLHDAAKALGIDPSTLTRAANRGKGPHSIKFSVRRSNGRRVFKGQDIINFWKLTV